MKKYILRSTGNSNFMFVVALKNVYYLTHNPNDATRFNTIGDAMKKSVQIKEKDNMLFQAVPVKDC